jgi:hypothetical protein
MIRMIGTSATAAAVALFSLTPRPAATRAPVPPPLVVHEWGTITTHHAPDGTAQGRLNRVGFIEPLADFVHRYEPPGTERRPVAPLIKAATGDGRPDITMRLETPVIYFHPARGAPLPAPFDVSVSFRGGVLNEFYPNASASVHGWNGAKLNESVQTSLIWKGVSLREHAALKSTTSRVWLAPRAVVSTPVITPEGESEQYVFYRGMANLPAVLATELTDRDLILRAPAHLPWLTAPSASLGAVWVVDIRPDGSAAFRTTDAVTLSRGDDGRVLARMPAFSAHDYSVAALPKLRESMHAALVARGLYADEATAMLETWKESYFGTAGLRVFYVVPDAWTSYYLPLSISTPHTLTRVIVGRIDINSATEP